MRILMTTDTIGGVWRFTQELVSGLLESNSAICLVSFGKMPSNTQRGWAKKMEEEWHGKFRYHATGFTLEWMQDNEQAYLAAAPSLMDLSASFDADIFHANQFCFGALPLSLPKVVTAHSDVSSWSSACRSEPEGRSAWLDRYGSLVAAGIAAADALVAPTRWMLNALSQNFTLPRAAYVIYNGRSVQGSSGHRKLQAVTCGRLWDEAKNIAVLGEVFASVPIVAAGDISCELATVPNLPGVTLLGKLDEDDLLSLFGESAVYICTSKYEPFGLAPLEAALCGCAVLANDIPSLREVWGDAAVYFNDAAALAASLEEFSGDPQRLALMQARSRERALFFSRERMTAAYLALFRELIEQTRGEGGTYAA